MVQRPPISRLQRVALSPRRSVLVQLLSSSRRLEAVLIVVFLVCLVQFVWLSCSLLLHDNQNPIFAPATSKSLSSFRRVTGSSNYISRDTAPIISVENRSSIIPPEAAVGRVQRRRRRKGVRRPRWDPGEGLKHGPKPLKVTLPVFVASLPKSGTTSVWQYFQCGGWRASHQWIKRDGAENRTELIGKCMYDNLQLHRPPFEGCGGSPVYTDTGFARFSVTDGPLCYYPSISALNEIHQHYRNATILLVVRDTSSWANSMMQWGNGTLLQRWLACELDHFPRDAMPDQAAVEHFYDWHNQHVRHFAQEHGMNYIEVSLESNRTGQQLEELIGFPASCWGRCTPLSKFCQRLTSPS